MASHKRAEPSRASTGYRGVGRVAPGRGAVPVSLGGMQAAFLVVLIASFVAVAVLAGMWAARLMAGRR